MGRGRKFKGTAERQDQGYLGHPSHVYLKRNIASGTEHLHPMPITLFNPMLRCIFFVKELFNHLFYTSGHFITHLLKNFLELPGTAAAGGTGNRHGASPRPSPKIMPHMGCKST